MDRQSYADPTWQMYSDRPYGISTLFCSLGWILSRPEWPWTALAYRFWYFASRLFKSNCVGLYFQTCFPIFKDPINCLIESFTDFSHRSLPRNCSLFHEVLLIASILLPLSKKCQLIFWGVSHTKQMSPLRSIGIDSGALGGAFAQIACLHGIVFFFWNFHWNRCDWDFCDRNSLYRSFLSTLKILSAHARDLCPQDLQEVFVPWAWTELQTLTMSLTVGELDVEPLVGDDFAFDLVVNVMSATDFWLQELPSCWVTASVNMYCLQFAEIPVNNIFFIFDRWPPWISIHLRLRSPSAPQCRIVHIAMRLLHSGWARKWNYLSNTPCMSASRSSRWAEYSRQVVK